MRVSSRLVTPDDVALIRDVRSRHPEWTRQALARHLCQVWDWRSADGSFRLRACRDLLKRLAAKGHCTLPAPRHAPGWHRPVPAPPPGPAWAPAPGVERLPLAELRVRLVRQEERPQWRTLLAQHHYLGFQSTVGEAVGYVATLGGHWVALLAWAAAAWKCRPRDAWIGWDEALKGRRLHLVANNVRFLILPGVHIPNLASKVLALNVRRLSADWQARYGHPLLLVETFVDATRFPGTCYRAAGWRWLGQTRGFGRSRQGYVRHGHPKHLFVRPLRPDAAQLLAAPWAPPRSPSRQEGRPMLDGGPGDLRLPGRRAQLRGHRPVGRRVLAGGPAPPGLPAARPALRTHLPPRAAAVGCREARSPARPVAGQSAAPRGPGTRHRWQDPPGGA
ncbi:MAG: DUF4338 domain-containing protein [candidate division NC10 bacterium]|nr:DUF4338 domain-containing protein [candidate division NC10 bacterium]